MQRIGDGMAVGVEPALAVEAVRFHHERIGVPLANGVALPRGVGILRQRTPISEDLAEDGARFVEDQSNAWGLDDLPRGGYGNLFRNDGREAEVIRIVLAAVVHAPFILGGG